MASKYPKEITEYIYKNYKGVGPSEMAKKINEIFNEDYTHDQIKHFYSNHKLNSGLTGHFEKGHISPNKGKKGHCYVGCEKGWFQKGHNAINKRKVGSERINIYGYIEVKIADPDIWRTKQSVVWEKYHGPIPDGFKIIFLDGNKLNTEIENLDIVPNDVMLEINRNGLRYDDAELTKTGILIAKLNCAARKRKKNN